MTTGLGFLVMMLERQVRPSISGMLMSSVMTSGSKDSSADNASAPLRASITWHPPRRCRISLR